MGVLCLGVSLLFSSSGAACGGAARCMVQPVEPRPTGECGHMAALAGMSSVCVIICKIKMVKCVFPTHEYHHSKTQTQSRQHSYTLNHNQMQIHTLNPPHTHSSQHALHPPDQQAGWLTYEVVVVMMILCVCVCVCVCGWEAGSKQLL